MGSLEIYGNISEMRVSRVSEHCALRSGALWVWGSSPVDVVAYLILNGALKRKRLMALLDAYPEGVKATDENGYLPLLIALSRKCEVDVVKATLDAYPEGAKEKDDKRGNLPLHIDLSNECRLS